MTTAAVHNTPLEAAVWRAIQSVIDPELGFSLVDLGMVRSVTVTETHALIELALTTPICPLADWLAEKLREAALKTPGVQEATVRLVDMPWPMQDVAPWRRWLDEIGEKDQRNGK